MEMLAGDIDAYVSYSYARKTLPFMVLYSNQDEFPALIFYAIQKLCTCKWLGSTLMSFLWAFHDDKNDGIGGGM
jgi:hypothetical protein